LLCWVINTTLDRKEAVAEQPDSEAVMIADAEARGQQRLAAANDISLGIARCG
jgi:hypothetical protein